MQTRRPDSVDAASPRFRRVGVLLHPHRAVEGDLERSLLPALEFLRSRAEVALDSSFRTTQDTRDRILALGVSLASRTEVIEGADLVVTFGGDGSLIAAASEIRNHATCLVGINAGSLGFLTEGPLDEGLAILQAIFEGRGWLDRRLKLRAHVDRGGDRIIDWEATNDVVVRQGRTNSLLVLDATIDGVELITYRADGVVASTPSGSTAYALATGGPIVHPSLDCIQLTPIAPFTLSARAILIPTRGVIRLEVRSQHQDATIAFDGQRVDDLATGDRIEIRASENPVNFLRVKRDDYYRTLREKLGWHSERR